MQWREQLVLSLPLLVLLLACGCAAPQEGDASMTPSQAQRVLLETTMGNITLELYSHMPVTAGNFASLVQKGYYNGTIFHRVIDGFMIQGGDPEGTGRGGPVYAIKDEFKAGNRNDRGTIAMANAGPNTGGSQFFINTVNNNFLDDRHPVFGRVVEGMDVVDRISKVKTGTGDRPVQEVKITRAVIL
jgi:peptidylprolyl isomerase